MRVEFPRVSLARYLPAVFAADPSAADFTDRFLSLFDVALRSIEAEIDTQARFFDPLSTPATTTSKPDGDFLSWLASWIGLSLDRYQPEERRRLLVKRAARLYQIRGTREGLRRQLLFYLGWDAMAESSGGTGDCELSQDEKEAGRRTRRVPLTCRPKPDNCAPPQSPRRWRLPLVILEHYRLRRWLFAGSARVGDQAVLWGRSIVNRSQLDENAQIDRSQLITTQDPQRDPFHVYAHKFTVFIPAWVGREPRYKRGFEKLLRAESPAHALGYVRYVEPRFRIGVQSSIGFDSVVGRYPQGVTLGDTPLGPASVLPEPPQAAGGPSMSVGKGTRIGASRLT
jgi:phage tail-like protein